MSEPGNLRMIKLQDVETVKFIELYGGERLLYDSNCKDYKDRDLRLAAARRISEAMGISGFGPKEVIAKFKNLRSSYCQELKKIADSERTDDVYVPKVIWFESMNSFIRPFVQQRSTKSNLMEPTNPSTPVSFQEESQPGNSTDIFSEDVRCLTKSPAACTINTDQSAMIDEETPTTFKRKTPPGNVGSSKMKKSSHHPQFDDIEMLDEISNRAVRIPKEDFYDHFGKYISSMLRTIGPPTAMRLQEEITRLITRAMCPPPPTNT